MSEILIVKKLLPGVALLQCPRYIDSRGTFTKFYHADSMASLGVPFEPAESFMTRSKAGVIRGMHFQVDEAAHDKLVFCPKGRVLDVIVDIRPESPQFNRPIALELSEEDSVALLIGKGYAHGYLSIDDDSWLLYATSTVHNPSLDRGVLWSSINFEWPIDTPILSDRDQRHPAIGDHI